MSAGEVGAGTGPVRGQDRPPAHNAALAAVAEIVGKLSTLAWTVVAARVLTQQEFGAFNLALALALIASAVAEGGFDPVLIQRASRDRRRLSTFHTQAIAWQVGIAIPVFAIAAAAVWLARSEAEVRTAIVLVLAALFLDLWSDTARASAAAARDQARVSGALALQRIAAAVLMIPALAAGFGLTGMAAAFLMSSVVGWIAHVRAVATLGVAFCWRTLDRRGMWAFGRGSWTLALSALVAIALFRVDAVLLAVLKGDEAVGQYAAAYRLFETMLFLTFAVVAAVAPLMNARADDRAEVARLSELIVVVLSFVYAPFVAVFLTEGRAVLELLYGARYEGATAAVHWLALTPPAYAVAAMTGAALVALERTRGIFLGAVVALVVNVTLNLVLIPSLGGTAAALATSAAYATEAAIGVVLVARRLPHLRIVAPFLETLAVAAVTGVLLEVSPLPVYVEVPLAGAVYVALWLGLVRTRRPERLAAVRTLLLRGPAPA